jgi:hypothetical protein
MAYFIAILGTGKGTWTHLLRIIRKNVFEHHILITNTFGKEHFNEPHCELIVVDFDKPLTELTADIHRGLMGKIMDTEVGLNLISGSGKEHMALLSAVLKSGLGVRLIDFDKEDVLEL